MQYDLIIVGGGVNGCGIFRDAALRGLKCLLIEKSDFGSETTGASSQMIHGGARYLFSNRKTTKLSSIDSGYIQKIAGHLLFRIPFMVPVYPKANRPRWMSRVYFELMETFFENYDRFATKKNSHTHTRLNREQTLELEPDLAEDLLGALTFDEWGIDTNRLCIGNVLAGEEEGGLAFNHHEVQQVLKEGGKVTGVRVKDLLGGEVKDFQGALVVNTTGPWADHFAKMAGCRVPLRPAKGVHVGFDRRLTNYAILSRAIDNRSIFMMPYQNTAFLGTTDDDYFGDPGDIPIVEDEVEYLLEGMERVFPRIREARMTHAWAGVRPTLYGRGSYEDDLSRDHRVFDHEAIEGVAGFLSLAGGKLASYRLMSEDLVDLAVKKLGRGGDCRTHIVPLPGADREIDVAFLAGQFSLDTFAVNRLVYRYGSRAYEVLELTREKPQNRNVLCECDPVLAAEARYVIRKEKVKTLEDMIRRTRLSLGPCQGTSCFHLAAQILGEELGYTVSRVFSQYARSLQKRWEQKRHILKGVALQQEELLVQTALNLAKVQ